MMKKKICCLGFIILTLLLGVSVSQNIRYYSGNYIKSESYLQDTDEIYIMEL